MTPSRRSLWLVTIASLTCVAMPLAAQEQADRFYFGAGVGVVDHTARQDGIGYDDAPVGAMVYGGAQLRERIALEASLQPLRGINSGDVLGSGVSRLRIGSDIDVFVLRAVLSLPLGDAFPKAARWTVFATAGGFDLKDTRTVAELNSGTTTSTTVDDSGTAIGAGALYDLPRLRLRAAVEQRNGRDTEQTAIGVTAEFRF